MLAISENVRDFLIFLGLLGLLLLYVKWNRNRMRQRVLDTMAAFAVGCAGNLKLIFCKDWIKDGKPTVAEYEITNQTWRAAKRAWPDLAGQMEDAEYAIWFVREPTQPVNYRGKLGVPWNEIPDMVGTPEAAEGQGYGGLSDRGSSEGAMYVATYFEGRAPLRLLAHEMTHCVKPLHGHTEEFAVYEKKLLVELGLWQDGNVANNYGPH